ncbi:MAG: OmpA family protein [Myxococcota bacterium]|nr:OmpA family protein [Myxococcota bacterium]
MKTYSRIWFISIILCLTTIGASKKDALAADGDGISLETFKLSPSMGAIFETTLPEVKEHRWWSIGGLVSYAHRPLRRETSVVSTGEVLEEADAVQGRVSLDLYGAIGLFDLAELGLVLPLVLFQSGEGTEVGGDIQSAGFADPRLALKVRIAEIAGLAFGVGAVVTAPLGHYVSSGGDVLGSTGPTAEPQVLAGFRTGPAIIALNVGVLFRPEATLANYTQTHALTWNASFAYDIRNFDEPQGIRLAIETNGEAGIGFDSLIETPMEAILGAKYRTEQDFIITAGAGPGMSTAVGTPAFRVFASFAIDRVRRSCPAGPEDMDGFEDHDKCIDPDNDQDGLLDGVDDCPNEAEDQDKFQDQDGCPDRDNDGDAIPDAVDKCPMIPEDVDDYEDDDGCPEEGPGRATVKITDSQILISSKIYFDFDKATIKPVSYPILNAVAEALTANTAIKKVQIEGHTDNEGTEDYNQKLSEDRAKAVMDYLINKKVQSERLSYKGYGFSRPKASNRTEEGKAINRRVEFAIIERD